MAIIFYCRVTKDTAKGLAEDLGIDCYNPYGKKPFPNDPKVIRWGVGKGIGYFPKIVVNKMNAVKKAVNKYIAIKTFIEYGIRTAPFITNDIIVPCVGRTKQHTQGQNFWLCWEKEQVLTSTQEGAEYFIKYIPVKQEYRIHVLGGKVAFAQRKYQNDRFSSAFMGIQGFSDSWITDIIDPKYVDKDLKVQAVKAANSLGLDFGGVDILISMEDNKGYVAEVNTGPCLPTKETRKLYTNFFKEKLEL